MSGQEQAAQYSELRRRTGSQLQSDLDRAGEKNRRLEAENTRLNSQVNQMILAPETDAQRIIRALAATEPPIVDGTYNNGNDWCIFCGNGNNPTWLTEHAELTEHSEDCPWRLAREWVQAHPVAS